MTLREHLEAIRMASADPWLGQFKSYQAFNLKHAEAALSILNASPAWGGSGLTALVDDGPPMCSLCGERHHKRPGRPGQAS